MLIRHGAHYGTDGKAIEVVVYEYQYAEGYGSQLRACAGLYVLGGPTTEGGASASLVHKAYHDAEYDQEYQYADIIGIGQYGYYAVVENVQNCTFKGEVGVEQAACQYTHEQGRVDLLRYQCQSNGDYGRKKGPRSVVEALRAKLSALGGESGYAEHYQRNGHHYDSRQRLAGR